ncbi:ImuA family protein [Ancylobacter pratisalsi]|uniref:Protein ImuA n=1 Tax=Ancylobacter pratisalsi TaxID=1745854 RepID=A0A6P1YQE4_9HYPH|nr:hypothetical protein [Ancylobacter pratisalsi]QIB34363.1 hypothetical protein G3A50_12065 [Ancylobacter pratisalsi]
MGPARDVSALRQLLAGLEAERLSGETSSFRLGANGPGPLALGRGALHEIQAVQGADMAAAAGFTLALALRASAGAEAAGDSFPRGAASAVAPPRPVLWVRQDMVEAELGRLDADGLAALGLDPARLILVRASDAATALRAGEDALRCAALGAVLIETWGTPKALDLTATRRLSLRADASRVTGFLLRGAGQPIPTAVATRWRVAPAASSPQGEGHAPGAPAFAATLLRHRGGEGGRPVEGGTWNLEWDRETCSFRDLAALPRAVVPVPSGRPAGADPARAGREDGLARLRRAG